MQNETVFEDTLAHDVDPDAHDDETIVFLELSFHNTSGLVLATRIEQSGHNAQVSEQIRAWARSHGGELEATVDEFGESTSFKISGVSAVASGGDEGSAGMVARVLDYWLEQYRAHGQSVFRERLVIDLPLERVSGRHAGIRHAENPRHPARPSSTDRRSVPVLSKTSIAGSMIAGSMIAGRDLDRWIYDRWVYDRWDLDHWIYDRAAGLDAHRCHHGDRPARGHRVPHHPVDHPVDHAAWNAS